MNSLINPYLKAGPNEVRGDQEGFWADVHYGVGVGLGLIGIDIESAETLMEVWEITEPGIFTGWGLWWEYQGRNNFEGGEEGIKFDMEKGLEGYDKAQSWWEKFKEIFAPRPAPIIIVSPKVRNL